MSSPTILLVEDDDSLGYVIRDNLEIKGYNVVWCQDGNEVEETFKKIQPNVCILDVMLPGKDGFSLARIIKMQSPETPVLFLTAKSMIDDKLEGFKIGADDYITKPFHIEELVYRIEISLKRNKTEVASEPPPIPIGQYQFVSDKLLLKHPSGSITLTFKEGEILKILHHHRHRIVKREEILNHVWGSYDYFIGRSMDVFISKLRKYLKEDPTLQIVNYHGVGFRLEEQSP
jgi:DNA-binding response OmpR family regulator